MSLPRKEARVFFNHDDHVYLKAICDVRGVTIAEFIESLTVAEIKRIVHDSTLIAAALEATGTYRRPAEWGGVAPQHKGKTDGEGTEG